VGQFLIDATGRRSPPAHAVPTSIGHEDSFQKPCERAWADYSKKSGHGPFNLCEVAWLDLRIGIFRSRVFGANVSGKFFIAPPHVLLHHFRERVAVGWPRGSEHPCTFRASATLKIRPINPYQRAARSHHWMPLAVCVVDGPGHSLSLATGLPWVCVEQTTGKDESHILRIDTAESVGKPEGTQQLLRFTTYGSDHSTPSACSGKAGESSQPVASMLGAISCLTLPSARCLRLGVPSSSR